MTSAYESRKNQTGTWKLAELLSKESLEELGKVMQRMDGKVVEVGQDMEDLEG